MKRYRNHVKWIVVMGILCCVALSGAEGPKRDLDVVLSRFQGYHVMTLEERDADVRTFIRQHFPKENPSIVHADFDGDGRPDYAVLIKDSKSTKLVVLLCPAEAECKSVYEVDVTTDAAGVYIRPVPIGSRVSQTDAIDTDRYPPPVRLSSTGIEVTYFEKAKVVYYWNRKTKKITAVQTEE